MAVLLPWSLCDARCRERQAGLTACPRLQVKVPKWCGQYVVGMDGYRDGVVGAKSKNLAGGTPSLQLSSASHCQGPRHAGWVAGLRGKLPQAINLPPSVTVPFGTFEEIMEMSENAELLKELDSAVKNIPEEHAEEALSKCREIVMRVSHLRLLLQLLKPPLSPVKPLFACTALHALQDHCTSVHCHLPCCAGPAA